MAKGKKAGAKQAVGGPTPGPGATGEALATRHPDGTYPPGSNGGVHRGPDLKPRNMMQAILLKAYSEESELALPPASKRSGAAKRKRARALHAMVDNTAKAMRRIMLAATEGDSAAFSPAIRLIHEIHEVLQPGKDEGRGPSGPIPRFIRPSRAPAADRTPAPGEPTVTVEDGDS